MLAAIPRVERQKAPLNPGLCYAAPSGQAQPWAVLRSPFRAEQNVRSSGKMAFGAEPNLSSSAALPKLRGRYTRPAELPCYAPKGHARPSGLCFARPAELSNAPKGHAHPSALFFARPAGVPCYAPKGHRNEAQGWPRFLRPTLGGRWMRFLPRRGCVRLPCNASKEVRSDVL